jgi:hypothetical protein
MSAGELLDLEGGVSRVCRECAVEISVVRPPRPLSSITGTKARRHLGAELKRQVPWEARCPLCRVYWNNRVKRCETGLACKDATSAPGDTITGMGEAEQGWQEEPAGGSAEGGMSAARRGEVGRR